MSPCGLRLGPFAVTIIVLTVFVGTIVVHKMESTWVKIVSKWIKKNPSGLG